ncbi:DUF3299 domain-containing protein [Gammaproteobacteria bacterium]|nr:DUF3299 domain-containing protein [Gammaproteobacteria bacterium]
MTFNRFLILALTVPLLLIGQAATATEELAWDALVAPGWDPASVFEPYSDEEIASMPDEQYDELRARALEMSESAPLNDAIVDKVVRLPGFIVPTGFNGTDVTEFLLVPYFGACIHTPPPPRNQIVLVKLAEPYTMGSLNEAVWLNGTLSASQSTAQLGEIGYQESLQVDVGYSMDVASIEPYVWEEPETTEAE